MKITLCKEISNGKIFFVVKDQDQWPLKTFNENEIDKAKEYFESYRQTITEVLETKEVPL